MKDERGGKIITKFETTALKTYAYSVQKDHLEIKNSASNELTLNDFDKCVHDVTSKGFIKTTYHRPTDPPTAFT